MSRILVSTSQLPETAPVPAQEANRGSDQPEVRPSSWTPRRISRGIKQAVVRVGKRKAPRSDWIAEAKVGEGSQPMDLVGCRGRDRYVARAHEPTPRREACRRRRRSNQTRMAPRTLMGSVCSEESPRPAKLIPAD